MKLSTRKLAVLVTGAALAASSPVLVQADKGGVPHSTKPCKLKKAKKKAMVKPNNKGKKCGFNRPPATTTTTTVAPTTTTTETSATTTTTAS